MANMYDIDPHIAEIYDQSESYSDDIELIRQLIGSQTGLRILEPFCGTGRILIPLARDGHELVGIDMAVGMLARAKMKISDLPDDIQRRIRLETGDVLNHDWEEGFDLVILGGNCFYELATPEEQEACIAHAAKAIKPNGHIYVDNNHMEGELEAAWQQPGIKPGFPIGICGDGTVVESATEIIWFDTTARLVRFRRYTRISLPGGATVEREYLQQKHPVSAVEMRTWLQRHGFVIEQFYGDRAGNPYQDISPRAIFWARKA